MTTEDDEKFRAMQARLADLLPRLNERDRRLALATEAKSWGYGGITAVQNATGVSRKTIWRGMAELSDDPTERPSDRVRAPGGGRKKAEVANRELADALESLTNRTFEETPNRRCGGPRNRRAISPPH